MKEKYQVKTLSINKNTTLDDIEKYLEKLNSNANAKYKLRAPARLHSRGALGLEVAFIQMIGTWLRKDYINVFHSHQSKNEFDVLNESLYGIALLSLSDKILTSDQKEVSRRDALQKAKDIMDNLRGNNFLDAFKGHYFAVPSIKKPGYEGEYDNPLYNNNEVKSGTAFTSLISNVIKSTTGVQTRLNRLERTVGIDSLSELIWELYKNTHDHGRTEPGGNILDSNFRGIILQQQDITKEHLKNWAKGSETRQQFFSNFKSSSRKCHVLDISIIDFGCGFVAMAKDSSTKETDEEILLECLKSGWSRSKIPNRGEGLSIVLKNIQKHKGIIRIRTSDLLVEKSYMHGDSFEISLNDIKKMSTQVCGTSINILIPLNDYMER